MKRSLPESPAHAQGSEIAGVGQAGVPGNEEEQERRKKRRGITEKRRRDRINDLLSQLQELIPSVAERKEAGKLEKAEVLEMAVMHMRNKLLASKAKHAEVRTTQTTCTWTGHFPVGAEDSDWNSVYDEFRRPSFIPIHAPLGFGQTLGPSIPPMSRSNTVDEVLEEDVEQTCHAGCYCNSHALL